MEFLNKRRISLLWAAGSSLPRPDSTRRRAKGGKKKSRPFMPTAYKPRHSGLPRKGGLGGGEGWGGVQFEFRGKEKEKEQTSEMSTLENCQRKRGNHKGKEVTMTKDHPPVFLGCLLGGFRKNSMGGGGGSRTRGGGDPKRTRQRGNKRLFYLRQRSAKLQLL